MAMVILHSPYEEGLLGPHVGDLPFCSCSETFQKAGILMTLCFLPWSPSSLFEEASLVHHFFQKTFSPENMTFKSVINIPEIWDIWLDDLVLLSLK